MSVLRIDDILADVAVREDGSRRCPPRQRERRGLDPRASAQSVIPNVTHLGVNAAIASLTQLGFVVDVTTKAPTSELTIAQQTPTADSTVAKGGTVIMRMLSARLTALPWA